MQIYKLVAWHQACRFAIFVFQYNRTIESETSVPVVHNSVIPFTEKSRDIHVAIFASSKGISFCKETITNTDFFPIKLGRNFFSSSTSYVEKHATSLCLFIPSNAWPQHFVLFPCTFAVSENGDFRSRISILIS